LEDVEETD